MSYSSMNSLTIYLSNKRCKNYRTCTFYSSKVCQRNNECKNDEYLQPVNIHKIHYRESVAGSVILTSGMVEFEEGFWIGNHLTAVNGLQRVCNIPRAQPGAVQTPRYLRGQTEF